MLMVLGSVPSSGCPAFETVVRTSGIAKSAVLTCLNDAAASSFEMLAGNRTLIHRVPSLSSGKNSEPSCVAARMEIKKPPKAMATTFFGLSMAQFRIGS